MASRFLIEYVAACPPKGLRPFCLEVYDLLMALSMQIMEYGALSDRIYFSIDDPSLRILPSGRLAVDQESYHRAIEQFLPEYSAGSIRKAKESFASVWHVAKIDAQSQTEFDILYDRAFIDEFGCSIEQFGRMCGEAVPSADMAPGLIVLGANLKVANSKGERIIPVEDFFIGPAEAALSHYELVVEVQVPDLLPGSGMVYIKHTLRAAMELAIVGVATLITLKKGICREVKIALGAVAPTPMRATKAESILRGKPFSAELVKQAAETASKEARPISDIRGTAEYRKEMVRVLTQRALNQVWEGAR